VIQSIQIRGYRSLREFRLKPGRVTVVTGGNGVGKSNVYRALALLQRMAEGRFAEALAAEGGMPSALWAGKRSKDEPRRISWDISHSDFEFGIRSQRTRSQPALGPHRATRRSHRASALRNADPHRHPFTRARGFDRIFMRCEEYGTRLT